ncbi:MAG: 16S rRNA (cytosine(1402)-N(4))-methyltransferase RsmH [bacterium]
MNKIHVPVLLGEVIGYLQAEEGGTYIDCTVGAGGHSEEILKLAGAQGKLIAIDRDDSVLELARQRLRQYKNTIFVHSNFDRLKEILREYNITSCSGILLDLGVSSLQLDKKSRGFSFSGNAPLDMRMDTTSHQSAKDLVRDLSQEELAFIIKEYGEERWAKRIASAIVEEREKAPITTTARLVSVVAQAIPRKARPSNIHFATRTFQALRIAVNNELEALRKVLPEAIDALKVGGRLCVISFHSLEDRIAKDVFRDIASVCSCPSDFPVCVCNKKKKIKLVTRKPVIASKDELNSNPRSRSAKMRVVEKI